MHGICDSRSYIGSYGGGIWAFLFPLSKLPELVDTAFIVLRKQKMVFLHWYHHITGNAKSFMLAHVLGACAFNSCTIASCMNLCWDCKV